MLSLLALLPTIFLLWVAIDGRASAAVIAVIIVNLTRIFHILGSLSALVSEILDWNTEWARVKVIFDFFNSPPVSQGCVDVFGNITINGDVLDDLESFVETVAVISRGRYTIRGDNGSGKTTLLLRLKSRLGEKSVYFPPGEPGLLWSDSEYEGSTGEKVLNGLRSVVACRDATHLLLDEWDANLDKVNMDLFNDLLEDESKKRVIVEVRH